MGIFKKKINNYLILLFFFLILISIFIFKHYGISIDEEGTRYHGLVSFNYIIEVVNKIFNTNILTDSKLPTLKDYPFKEYGVFFELASITIEKIFKITEFKEIFYFRHFLTNFVFLISVIFFSKLIYKNLNSIAFSIWGGLMLYTSPRIFAQSFYNSKDIIFLAFFIISIYYCFSFLKDKKYKYLILSCVSLALLTATRVIGMYLFFVFIIFLLIEVLEGRKSKVSILNILKIIVFYFLFTYFLWPFLWENPVNNFVYAIASMSKYNWAGDVFYLGKYHHSHYLPWHYLFTWIFISNSIGIIFIVFLSLIFNFYRTTNRLLKINDKKPNLMLWKNSNELLIFLNIVVVFVPIFLIILNNSTLYSGWRHAYFLFPSLLLIGIFGINQFFIILRKKKFYYNILSILCLILLSLNVFNLIKLHPYQNVYFNLIIEKRANKLFEIDYWGLANVEVLKKLAMKNSDVFVCNIGLMDLNMSKRMLSPLFQKNINVRGQDFGKCNYIVKNNLFLSDPKYTKKYKLPYEFKKIDSINRGNIVISEIFERQ